MRLSGPGELDEWLAARKLTSAPAPGSSAADHRGAIELREALRALMLHNNGASPRRLCHAESSSARHVEVSSACASSADASVTFAPGRDGVDGALARLLVPVARAIADGSLATREGLPRRRVARGLLRPLAQPLRRVVRDGGVWQPHEGPRLPRARRALNITPRQEKMV